MKKSQIVALVVILLILLVAGYYYWQFKKKEVSVGNTSGEVVPSVSTNPLENKPDLNPVDQTNPFKKIKTNPFE